MAEEVKKVEEAAKAGWQAGKDLDEATGAHEAWASGAYNEDPELAKSAADDWDRGDHAKAVGKFVRASGEAAWDRGDHAKAVGKFVRASGEAAWDAAGDFIDGITGHVDAEAPPAFDIPMEPEQIGPVTEVAHEEMP